MVSVNLKYIFIAGCGVGNAIALLPSPNGDDSENTSLDEFIYALYQIGLKNNKILLDIKKITKLYEENNPKLYFKFFDSIKKIPDLVRKNISEEDYVWFQLGEVLYDVVVSLILKKNNLAEGDGVKIDEIVDNTFEMKLNILEKILTHEEIPENIKSRIFHLINRIKSKENSNEI